ncbi:MAG: hypothetical protein ABI183_20465 [Polyangiaceae bacterium]
MAKKNSPARKRRETRFFPQSNANPVVIRVIGAVGAVLLGAGAYEQLWSTRPEPWKYTPYLLAAGALSFAMSIWFGTSGDMILRVGDGGVGVDRGDVRRIPWHGITDVFFDPQLKAVSVKGKDEGGTNFRINAKLKSQAQAAAWIVKEATARIPKIVEVTGDGADAIPDAQPSTDVILLDDLQVVGRKDALTGKTIAYEPDARICKRCERIYYKKSVPKKCACGALLTDLRLQADNAASDDDEEEADEEAAENEEASATDATADTKEASTDEETA